MRIIHCADLHLDSKLNAHLDGAKKKERKAELLATFLRMVDYANENEIDAILIAGDLFDTGNLSVTARKAVTDAIVNAPQTLFFYLRGNHDADSFLSSLEELPPNLKLFSKEWITYPITDHVTVSGVELDETNSNLIYDTLVLANEKINIVMLHGQEAGYEQKTRHKAEVIVPKNLRGKGIDYLALGHIHTHRMEQLDARGVYCYSGCLEGRGFDECGEKGFVLLEIDEEKDTVDPVFIPFAKRTLYTVPVDVSGVENTSEAMALAEEQLKTKHYPADSMIKLVLSGRIPVTAELDTALVSSRFEDMYYYVKTTDETKPVVDFESFRHESSLKGEFVRCVMQAEDLSDEMKAEVIRCGIFALSGEEIGV